jgi:two-component system sensor histidine kinase YesM
MRYKDKLDYSIRVDDAVLDYKTIKVVLQPIVENAIYHGIKNKRGPGTIVIRSEEAEEDILLQVIDNGAGMDEEKIRKLLLPGPGPESEPGREAGRGVGISNVNRRLQLYFGAKYGLSFESVPGEGTTVTIRIPKHV